MVRGAFYGVGRQASRTRLGDTAREKYGQETVDFDTYEREAQTRKTIITSPPTSLPPTGMGLSQG